jgi:acyl carrier protein
MTALDDTIRHVLGEFGGLTVDASGLADTDDLYQAGFTSHASVNVMLGLEDAFDIEFDDSLLKKSTFQSVAAIREALESSGVKVDAE